jgi:hypothetical protein
LESLQTALAFFMVLCTFRQLIHIAAMTTEIKYIGLPEALVDRFRKALQPHLVYLKGGSLAISLSTTNLNIQFNEVESTQLERITDLLQEEYADWLEDETYRRLRL